MCVTLIWIPEEYKMGPDSVQSAKFKVRASRNFLLCNVKDVYFVL